MKEDEEEEKETHTKGREEDEEDEEDEINFVEHSEMKMQRTRKYDSLKKFFVQDATHIAVVSGTTWAWASQAALVRCLGYS